MKRTRLDVEDLYILGAGSSYALSKVNTHKKDYHNQTSPLDKDFLNCFYQEFSSGSDWKYESFNLLKGGWLDKSDFISEGLESAIIKRVSQFEFLSNLNKERSRRKCSNKDYLYHLSHLIAFYLSKTRSNSSGNTKVFINNVFPTIESIESYRNRIITFNYDILLDRVLLDRKVPIRQIYFDRLVNSKPDGIERKSSEKFLHPLILKMHGSINWHCDRSNFDEILFGEIDPKKKFPIFLGQKSPLPKDNNSPLIIPPIPNKPLTRVSLFKFLWSTAFEYLHEAKRIIIIGYSCPNTDTLAKVLFSHFNNKELREIIVVDPDPIILKKYRELIDLPKNNKVQWKYFGSFEDYIKVEMPRVP